jgi:hypothetical protein
MPGVREAQARVEKLAAAAKFADQARAERTTQNKEAQKVLEAQTVRKIQKSLELLSMDDTWSLKAQTWSEDLQPPEVETASQGVLSMMKRAATVTEQNAAGYLLPIVTVTATSCLGEAFCAGNVCKGDQTEWAVTKAYASEKSAICLTMTLARAMRVAAISLMHRNHQESRETQVFTSMYVQTPDLRMPGNQITIPQDKRPHEFLLPKPFVGQVIQLAFDKKKVAGNGEPPGLRGILMYGHEPDAEIDVQGGREGHKKVRT